MIETGIGPILDLEQVQLSVHISADAPAANGRRWAGVPLQARAEEIARTFLQRPTGVQCG